MTNWQPVSELTPEIVEAAWRLIVWNGEETWTFDRYLSDDGTQELNVLGDSDWFVEWNDWAGKAFPVTHFAIINAPPGAE